MDWENQIKPLALNEQDALPELAVAPLLSWKVITVSGEDRKSYLQGQLTCDVVTLAEESSTLGAHCDAKGKVWSAFRLFNHQNSYALFQHGSGIDKALAEIRKYSVFSKVEINISADITLGIMGEKANAFIEEHSSGSGNVRSFMDGTAVKMEENRWLLLITEADAETLISENSLTLYSESLWDLCDIKASVPRVTCRIQNEHIPQAFNLQAIGGISFNKGCYTGQETVARAKYRGTNKRALYILKGHCNSTFDVDSELERSVGQNWRSVGEFITYYQYQDGTVIGLIILPNNLEPDTKFRLCHNPESHFAFEPMPYPLENS